jgi:hypothetical protein
VSAGERVARELADILDGEEDAPQTVARLSQLAREARDADSLVEQQLTLRTAAQEARALARRLQRLTVRVQDAMTAAGMQITTGDDLAE